MEDKLINLALFMLILWVGALAEWDWEGRPLFSRITVVSFSPCSDTWKFYYCGFDSSFWLLSGRCFIHTFIPSSIDSFPLCFQHGKIKDFGTCVWYPLPLSYESVNKLNSQSLSWLLWKWQRNCVCGCLCMCVCAHVFRICAILLHCLKHSNVLGT